MADIHLIVIGASGSVGSEVARLGVAYGADVFGITLDGEPPTDDPWTHGVTWIAADAAHAATFADLPPAPTVVAAPVTPAESVLTDGRRVVWLNPVTLDEHTTSAPNVVQAFATEIDSTPVEQWMQQADEDASTIRVETVAMALLRAALQDDVATILDQQQLAFLGDAVMLQ